MKQLAFSSSAECTITLILLLPGLGKYLNYGVYTNTYQTRMIMIKIKNYF